MIYLEHTADFKKITFVHNALPDLSLSEVDTSFNLDKVKIGVPILLLVEKEDDAKNLSKDNKDIPFAVKEASGLEICLDGECKKVGKHNLEGVGDGLEAAKVIRTNGIPFVKLAQLADFSLYVRQLKIAMFLTNSKDINSLKNAPIYAMS